MKKFVPYELASRMKKIGFDEECIAYYQKSAVIGNDNILPISFTNMASDFNDYEYSKLGVPFYSAPTWQQAFRWFREKYALCIVIKPIDDKKLELGYNLTKNGLIMGAYTTYEEAELACLDKLIEIVEGRES